jgi:hypothetical protein
MISKDATYKKTLDVQHHTKLKTFNEHNDLLNSLKNKLAKNKASYDKLNSKPHEDKEAHIQKLIALKDDMVNLESQITSVKNKANELDYLLNTGNILFKYYDIIDKGDESTSINKGKSSDNSILKYLLKQQENIVAAPKENVVDRATLLEKYMAATEFNYVKQVEHAIGDKCPGCGFSDRNVMLNDGLVQCNHCNTVEYIIIDHDRPSYKDQPREVSYFSYKRKMIDALKSHMPRLAEYLSWKNICDLRMILIIIPVASSFYT